MQVPYLDVLYDDFDFAFPCLVSGLTWYDSDGDSYPDSEETTAGFDPFNPASFPYLLTVYEDATINGWGIYDDSILLPINWNSSTEYSPYPSVRIDSILFAQI